MTTTDNRPAQNNQLFAPGAWSMTFTLDGITVVGATTWHAYIVAAKGDDAATDTQVTPTVTANSGANTVTFSLTDSQVASLLAAGAPKFAGWWSVYYDTLDVTLVAGSFVVDRTATRTGDGGATTLTYDATTGVTLTVTASVPPTAFDAAGAATAAVTAHVAATDPHGDRAAALGSAVAMAIVLGGN